MIAGKQFDPVLGVDIHIIQPPPPAPPVPIPHPHIGMVLDPFALALGTVKVNSIPSAAAGTGGMPIPSHIPIGGVFVKPPGNENEIFMGSATVTAEDEPLTSLGMPVLSCSDVGMPSPPRKKGGSPKSLVLPTSVVLCVPMGRPVLVGGPPTISLMAIGMRLGMAAFGKFRKFQKKSKWWKKVSKKLKGRKPGKVRSKVVCFLTGHPVDVVSGRMLTDATDLSLPGPIPLEFERTWYSDSTYEGPLGRGWHHRYDQHLLLTPWGPIWRAGDGRDVPFDPIERGQRALNREEGATLSRDQAGFLIETREGLRHHFPLSAIQLKGLDRQGRSADDEGLKLPLDHLADLNGNRIQLHYHQGRLIGLTDSAGRQLQITSDAKGRIVALHGPHPEGRRTIPLARYAYNEEGDLTEVWDALDQPFSYAHRGHLITQETHRGGLNFYFEYDRYDDPALARCTATWGDKAIFTRRLTYSPEQHITEVRDHGGALTTYFGNEDGLVERMVDALGRQTLYTWDGDCRKLAETNPAGETQRWTYDEAGRVLEAEDPTGARTTYAYDARGALVTLTDPCGNVWRRRYDGRRNLLALQAPDGAQWAYDVDARGLPLRALDPLGGESHFRWGPGANLLAVRDRAGATTELRYDAHGRLVARRDALGGVTKLRWDLLGRLTGVEDASGRRSLFTYDADGNLLTATDPLMRTRVFKYGPMGVVRKVLEPTGAETLYQYDEELDLTQVVDARGKSWHFKRDPVGQVTEEIAFDGRRLAYTFDKAGRLASMTDARHNKTAYERDEAGRLLKRILADGAEETFAYDAMGRLVHTQNDDAEVTFAYDAQGRVISESLNGDVVALEYDALGHRVARTSPAGRRIQLEWDAEDRLTALSDPQGELMRLNYDALGREISRALPGGLVNERDYLPTGEVSQISTFRETRLLHARRYRYDAAGQMEAMEDSAQGETTFSHDVEGRLVQTLYPDKAVERYLFDAAGNVPGIPEGPRIPAERGRVSRVDGWRLLWDDDGNLIEKIGRTKGYLFEYNAAGRLARAEVGPGHHPTPVGEAPPERMVLTFGYDPLGRRVYKHIERDDGTQERVAFRWDGDVLVGERRWRFGQGGEGEEAGAWREYIFRPDSFEPLAQLGEGGDLLIECDHLDTPRAAWSRSGELKWRPRMRAWGEMRADVGDVEDVPFRFPGQYGDLETGLYYNRFRYYSSDTKIYTTSDPLGMAGGINSHTYVPDPLELIDLFGLKKSACHRKPKSVKTKSTGRTKPKNKNEVFAIDHVKKHPENGEVIIAAEKIGDPCFKGKGWNKASQTVNGVEVHYMAKFDNVGTMSEVTDFKFK